MGVRFTDKELERAQARLNDVKKHAKGNVGPGVDVVMHVPTVKIKHKELDKITAAFFESHKVALPQPEWQFDAERLYRFDFAWPEQKVALEVEGGIFGYGKDKKKGAHGSVTGILRDMAKYNLAATNGWRIIRVIPNKLMTMDTIYLIKKALEA